MFLLSDHQFSLHLCLFLANYLLEVSDHQTCLFPLSGFCLGAGQHVQVLLILNANNHLLEKDPVCKACSQGGHPPSPRNHFLTIEVMRQEENGI